MNDEQILAVVTRIVRNGKHGPYAVSYAKSSAVVEQAITFSLAAACWEEKTMPEKGVMVVLSDVQRKYAGWRAGHARYVRSVDERLISENKKGLSDGATKSS